MRNRQRSSQGDEARPFCVPIPEAAYCSGDVRCFSLTGEPLGPGTYLSRAQGAGGAARAPWAVGARVDWCPSGGLCVLLASPLWLEAWLLGGLESESAQWSYCLTPPVCGSDSWAAQSPGAQGLAEGLTVLQGASLYIIAVALTS